MYQYIWDEETGGPLLITEISKFSKEPRPVYYRELDILGFDKYWNYPKDDRAPLMWAEANNYIYFGRTVARTRGGSLYTAPEIILLEEPEPDGGELRFVDIEKMVAKNADIMETLTQEMIKKVYNTYKKYQKRVDLFYVAFSGGKDSVVALDIVQRALPHNSFVVVFSDTQMEFSDTYKAVEEQKKRCENSNIKFIIAKSDLTPQKTWSTIGPPSTVTRWCCSVHKTAPQIIALRNYVEKKDFTGMAFVGVRGDESLARSKYDYISKGKKHKGQYSCNVILDWSSTEVFIHMYANKLLINEAYKKGNRRAGCLICPRAAERNDYMNHYCYYSEAKPLIQAIQTAYKKTFSTSQDLDQFIEVGGWKARKNGRDLSIPLNYYEKMDKEKGLIIIIEKPKTDWREWIKTIGVIVNDTSPYVINFQNKKLTFNVSEETNCCIVTVDYNTLHDNPLFSKHIKYVFRKTACCISCKTCQADCPYGCIDFLENTVKISPECRHCMQCHKTEKGCLVYKSLETPKGGITVSGKKRSLNSYSHHAPKMDWINQYFTYKNEFDNKHSLGSQMYSFFKSFLRDAELLDEKGFSTTAQIIENIGLENESSWAIILTNICYAPQVQWFVKNIDFNQEYSKNLIASMLIDDGAKESWTNDIFSSLTRMTDLPLGNVGMGNAIREKNRAVAINRTAWSTPDPRVILYSLYKFAEKCGEYYQFSLATLLDDTIERDGISPTRIFGLDRDTMVPILNGLSVNYSEFISASFTLGLDTISLRPDKTSEDVLSLF